MNKNAPKQNRAQKALHGRQTGAERADLERNLGIPECVPNLAPAARTATSASSLALAGAR